LTEQDGYCIICFEKCDDVLVIDHCHITGKVRGLLCQQCNAGLGNFKDDPKRLEKAISYLKGEQNQ